MIQNFSTWTRSHPIWYVALKKKNSKQQNTIFNKWKLCDIKLEISVLLRSFSVLNTSITVKKCFKLIQTRKEWMHFILLLNISHSLRSSEATILSNNFYYNFFQVYERSHSRVILNIANSTVIMYVTKD